MPSASKLFDLFLISYKNENFYFKKRIKYSLIFFLISSFLAFLILVFEIVYKKDVISMIGVFFGLLFLLIEVFLIYIGKYKTSTFLVTLIIPIIFPIILITTDHYNHPFELYRISLFLIVFNSISGAISNDNKNSIISIFINVFMITLVYIIIFFVQEKKPFETIVILTYITTLAGVFGITFLSHISIKTNNENYNELLTQKKIIEDRLKITEIYTRRSIVEFIEKGKDPTKYLPEIKNISILFSDIRDFTTLSEHLTPIQTVDLLNDYFNEMNDCIIQLDGEIDKLIGDCIMALFYNPDKSVRSAIKMREKLTVFNTQNKIKVNNGIGINFGEVVLGNIGSKTKMDYTVIGDIVNSASRMEALTKYYGVPIIISEDLKNVLIEDYKIRFIDHVLVKGKKQPTKIYEVFDFDEEETINSKLENQKIFDEAFKLYENGNFEDSIKIYSELSNKIEKHNYINNKYADKLLDFYIYRCKKLQEQKETGKLENWNGVYEFFDK